MATKNKADGLSWHEEETSETTSTDYCRACGNGNTDGLCSYHALQIKKFVHQQEKHSGLLHDPDYQEEKKRFWLRQESEE